MVFRTARTGRVYSSRVQLDFKMRTSRVKGFNDNYHDGWYRERKWGSRERQCLIIMRCCLFVVTWFIQFSEVVYLLHTSNKTFSLGPGTPSSSIIISVCQKGDPRFSCYLNGTGRYLSFHILISKSIRFCISLTLSLSLSSPTHSLSPPSFSHSLLQH